MKRSKETLNQQKTTREATRKRRESQICKVFQLKLNQNHFSKIQAEFFEGVFIERKRFYNHIIGFLNSTDPKTSKLNQLKDFDSKINNIQYAMPLDLAQNLGLEIVSQFEKIKKYKNKIIIKNYALINYELKYLTAKMKQDIVADIRDSLKGLKKLRQNKRKTGQLKYLKSCHSISLSQYRNQYELTEDGKLRFAINQQLNKKLTNKDLEFKLIKIHGFDQLDLKKMELTSAKLIRKPSGLYLHITTYQEKQANPIKKGKSIGLDLGIKATLTTSDGQSWNIRVPITKRQKIQQKKLARQQKSSNNYVKTLDIIKKEYEKQSNKKEDISNKIVAELVKKNDFVVFQDDNISAWKRNRGMSAIIQRSCLGRLKTKLTQTGLTKKLSRNIPTTKLCYCCGAINPCPLGQDMYFCPRCGLYEQRDLKAAKTTLFLGLEWIVFDQALKTWTIKPQVSAYCSEAYLAPLNMKSSINQDFSLEEDLLKQSKLSIGEAPYL